MEIVLLAITVVSLLAAVVMSIVAWRLARDERVRSAARVAALAAAAGDQRIEAQPRATPVVSWAPAGPPPGTAGEDRPGRTVAAVVAPPWPPPRPAAPLGDSFLGSGVTAPSSGGQRGLAVAAAVLFVITMTGAYAMFYGGGPATGAASADAAQSPVELVSLRHERDNSRLTITGLVRNPATGAPVDGLSAVAFLFDQQGGLVASSRADIDFRRLAPGDESPFVITVDASSNAARYRVSFRNDVGVVPHIDRRGQEPIARDTP